MKFIETIREFAFIAAVLVGMFVVARLCSLMCENSNRRVIDATIPLDSVPTSKCYSKTIVVRGVGASDLGSNPMVNHQVPCDYKGNDNNWDDDLSKIK